MGPSTLKKITLDHPIFISLLRVGGVALAIFLLTSASRWPLATYYSISVVWPASGLLWFALVQRRLTDVTGIILGLVVWGITYQGSLGLLFAVVSLVSPVVAWLLSLYWRITGESLATVKVNLAFVAASIAAATVFAAFFSFSSDSPVFDLLNLWFVYFFVDLSSYLVVLPAFLVGVRHHYKSLEWRVVSVVLIVLASPYLLAIIGFNEQVVRGSHFLVIPLLTWLAVFAKQSTLAISIVLIFTLQMVYSARGWMGYRPLSELFEFMQWYVVLLAVVITTLVLAFYSQHRELLLQRFKDQASRDDQTGALNNRGLDSVLAKQSGYLFVLRNLDSAALKAALSWQEFQSLEQAIVDRLTQDYSRYPVARVGTGEFAVLLPIAGDLYDLQNSLQEPYLLNQRGMQLRFDISYIRHNKADQGSLARCLNGLNLLSQRQDEPVIDCDARSEDIAYYEGLTHLHQYWLAKIQQGALALHLQPIVNLKKPSYKAYEVLLRLEIDGVLLPPKEILETFEVMKDLQTLDRLVVNELLRLLKRDAQQLQDIGHISFNLTGTSIQSTLFVDELLQAWRESQFPSSKMVIEITENEKIVDLQRAVENAQRLRDAGFAIAIDDFGEGEASFAYLKRFPCDTVKIDGQFVRTIENNLQDRAIVAAIVQVAKVMNLQTVAEFVENESMIAQLTEMGVDYVQGYALGRPVSWASLFNNEDSE